MTVSATVLIADDQASPRNRVASILREAGYRVLLAADGLQALANCRREQPDMVVLDMIMPHMDGIAVCRALRGDPVLPYIPVMFCSSHDATADRVTGLRAGGDDFVGKDIADDELLARVEALVRVKKLLDEALRTQESPGDTQIASASGEPIANLDHHLDREFNRALKHNQPLSLVIVAIPAGSEAASKIQACGRGDEIIASHPGKGYAVLLPNTHFGGAMASAERIWRSLPASGADGPGATIGAASYPNPAISTATDLVDFAHAALDRARGEGTSYICLYHHQAYLFRPDE